jgi:integrase
MKGHLTQRSPGSWTIWIDLGTDPGTKKRKQKTLTVKTASKREAQKELNRILHEMQTGMFVEPTKLTVGDYLQRWLNDAARATTSNKTFERYEQIVRVSLVPALGHIKLDKLTALQIQSFYRQSLEDGARKDGRAGGLSPTTVRQYHAVLRRALQQAVKWGFLVRNVADCVDVPHVEQNEQRALSIAEAKQLFDALEASGSWLHLPVVLAVASGFRRGEILGLTWADLDSTTGLLTVRRSLEVTNATGIAFKPPKTRKGARSITLPQFAVTALKKHKAQQSQARLALGPAYQDQGLIFARDDGAPHNPDHLSSQYAHWLARRPELPRVRFHDLRHSNATILFQQGEHPKVVSERLGHASVKITMDVYSHVLPEMQVAAAGRLDAAFGGQPEARVRGAAG